MQTIKTILKWLLALSPVVILLAIAWLTLHPLLLHPKLFNHELVIHFEVDPMGFAVVLINMVLVVYVLRELQQKDDSTKVRKDIYIESVRRLFTSYYDEVKEMLKGGMPYNQVVTKLFRHSTFTEGLISTGCRHHYVTPDSKITLDIQFVQKDIRKLLTTTPKKGDIADGVELRKGNLHYSESQVDKVVDRLVEMDAHLFDLVVEITSSKG